MNKKILLFALFSLLIIQGCKKDVKQNEEEVNCEPGEFYLCNLSIFEDDIGARICKKNGKHFSTCFRITNSTKNAFIISKGKSKAFF
jgi:hypothetical protein